MVSMPFSVFAITGKAGTGKTTVADTLCGAATNKVTHPTNRDYVEWSQMALAYPIKELLNVKKNSAIENKDRRLYQIHSIVSGVYGDSPLYGAPPYDDLIELVKKIESMSIGSPEDKHRKFQQKIGDKVRSFNEDAFAQYLASNMMMKTSEIERTMFEHEAKDNRYHRVFIVSDVRFDNEIEYLKKRFPIKTYELLASKKVRKKRLQGRDGGVISSKQAKHKSENGIDDKHVDVTIDTDMLSEEEVIEIIKNDIYGELGVHYA